MGAGAGQGGVLFVDKICHLLPLHGRTGNHDYGSVVLQVLDVALLAGNPLVIMVECAQDLQRAMTSSIGFKG